MSKRNISNSGKVSEEPVLFDADLDDEIIEFDDSFFEHARVCIGGKVIREATGRLTREGVVPYPKAEKDEQ
jgi:hypothetical protein